MAYQYAEQHHDQTITNMRAFDPNEIKEPYATWIYGRSPNFKLHRNRGAALNAISSESYAVLYKHEGGSGWVEVLRFEGVGPDNCEDCGRHRIKGQSDGYNYSSRRYGPRVWLKQGSKIVDPPEVRYVCRDCARGY